MFCLHQPVMFEFIKRNTKLYKEQYNNISNNNNTNLISIYDELNNISKFLHKIMSKIDLKNIKKWNSGKKNLDIMIKVYKN